MLCIVFYKYNAFTTLKIVSLSTRCVPSLDQVLTSNRFGIVNNLILEWYGKIINPTEKLTQELKELGIL